MSKHSAQAEDLLLQHNIATKIIGHINCCLVNNFRSTHLVVLDPL